MLRKLSIMILLALFCHGIALCQQSSSKLILKDGKPFTGNAEFKFAIVGEGLTLWSNDLSSGKGEEPLTSFSRKVEKGVFELQLGGEGMASIYPDLLEMFPQKELIVWINIGDGFEIYDAITITDEQLTITDESNSGAPLIETALNQEEKKKEKNKMDGAQHPDRYFEYRMMQKGYDRENVSMGTLLQAKAHLDQMPQLRDAGLWVWQWLGPSNIGGRVRAIAIRPDNSNTILVGGVSGGIWRSTNKGSSWTAINDFLPSLAVTSIVIDHSNNNIMYAATGEGFWNHDCLPGAGIFKTTNGGTSWTQLASTDNDNFRWVNRLAMHPDSASVLYAVTGYGRVYKTTDGGTTWVHKFTTVNQTEATDVDVHPNYPQYILVGAGDNAYLSTNYGNSFTELTTGAANKLPNDCGRCECTFCPSYNGKFYVSMNRNKGEIWRSTDYGSTWSRRNTGKQYLGNQGWYNNIIWVDPTSSDRIVVGGIDVWRSTDGGTTLTRISDWTQYHNNSSANSAHADHHMIIHPPDYNTSTNPLIYVGNDGGIQTTGNVWTATTSSWTNLAGTSLGITQFFGGAAYPDGSVIVGGTQDNDHLRYRSSGSWSGANNWFQAETGDGGFAAIKPTNSNVIYSEYVYLEIQKSTNGGASYFNAISGLGDAGNDWSLFISPFVMDPNNSSTLIAGGQSIWRTTNEAGLWSRIRDSVATDGYPKCSAIDIAQGNSDIIWVGYHTGQVAKTTNGTATPPTWTRVDNNGATPLPNRFVTDIAINPFNHNEVWVTFGGNHSDCVWRTTNGGTSWEERTGTAPYDLPAVQVNSIRVHPNNQNWIYIGTDLGVLASEDKGANWCVLPRYPGVGHEGPVNTEVSELFWQGEFLIAATHGRGMYRAAPLTTIYVDLNAAAGGNGTYAAPYQTVTQAVNNQGPGSNISIAAGSYNESGTVLFTRKCYVYITNSTGTVIIY